MQNKTLQYGCNLVGVFLAILLLVRLRHILLVATTAARIFSCSSNIKELTQGIALYSQDWDDRLPPASAWRDAIQPTFSKQTYLFCCPDFPAPPPILGLAYNSLLSHKCRKEVLVPAVTPLLYDSNLLQANAHAPGIQGLAAPPRHHDHTKNAVGFLDGHVEHWNAQGTRLR